MNKNIIIAILVVIIIAVGAAFVVGGQNGKTNTQLNIVNNETFQNGEQVQFQLKDDQGNAISGKTVNINFNNQKYSITTDQNGKGYLTITGIASGKYDLEVSFTGDDKYNGCDAKASITIDTSVAADNPAQQTSSEATVGTSETGSSSSSGDDDRRGGLFPQCTYNEEWGVWVDSNGIVVCIGDGNCEQMGVGLTLDMYIKMMNHEWVPPDLADDNDTNGTDPHWINSSAATDDSDSDA
jgi:hypothetical protein